MDDLKPILEEILSRVKHIEERLDSFDSQKFSAPVTNNQLEQDIAPEKKSKKVTYNWQDVDQLRRELPDIRKTIDLTKYTQAPYSVNFIPESLDEILSHPVFQKKQKNGELVLGQYFTCPKTQEIYYISKNWGFFFYHYIILENHLDFTYEDFFTCLQYPEKFFPAPSVSTGKEICPQYLKYKYQDVLLLFNQPWKYPSHSNSFFFQGSQFSSEEYLAIRYTPTDEIPEGYYWFYYQGGFWCSNSEELIIEGCNFPSCPLHVPDHKNTVFRRNPGDLRDKASGINTFAHKWHTDFIREFTSTESYTLYDRYQIENAIGQVSCFHIGYPFLSNSIDNLWTWKNRYWLARQAVLDERENIEYFQQFELVIFSSEEKYQKDVIEDFFQSEMLADMMLKYGLIELKTSQDIDRFLCFPSYFSANKDKPFLVNLAFNTEKIFDVFSDYHVAPITEMYAKANKRDHWVNLLNNLYNTHLYRICSFYHDEHPEVWYSYLVHKNLKRHEWQRVWGTSGKRPKNAYDGKLPVAELVNFDYSDEDYAGIYFTYVEKRSKHSLHTACQRIKPPIATLAKLDKISKQCINNFTHTPDLLLDFRHFPRRDYYFDHRNFYTNFFPMSAKN